MSKYITNNSEIYSDNSDEEISDKESIDAYDYDSQFFCVKIFYHS